MRTSEIIKLIESIPNWFHRIEVSPGIFTPGVQESQALIEKINLPKDLSGFRVLDIGARDGLFSFECEKRGAKEVIAIDYASPDTTGFNVAKEILSSKVTWITANVYEINNLNLGKFDLILFLGVIYHLRHPYLAIDLIHDSLKVGGQVIVESHVIDGGFVAEDKSWINLDQINSRLIKSNVAQIYQIGQLVDDPTSAWAPSLQTLETMFVNSGFSINSSWSHHFRGGLTATSKELPLDHPRFIDTGYWLDLGNTKRILRPKKISSLDN